MILGLTPFAAAHTLITLVAIVSGLAMLNGMLRNRRRDGATALFLLFSVLTAITGFLLPYAAITPAVVLGIVLSVLLVPALASRYVFRMAGAWRWIFVVTALVSLYLNCFVLVVQSFQKIPPLHALAPGIPPAGPIFAATQGLVLIAFIVAGYLAVRRFRPR
ncbi:MAG TPA: hypothetical protein VGB91_15130 [Rhizomicrobium sp.]